MASPALPFALILAGGLGRRMGAPTLGAPAKPLVALGGRPLIAHVIDRLRPQVSDIWINANDDRDAYAAFDCPIVPDTIPGCPGPLAGVLAGLERLAEVAPGASLLTVPADTPFLPANLARRLVSRQLDTGKVVCARSGGRRHPVVALWPQYARTALRQNLAEGHLKVGLLLEALDAVTESWDEEPEDPFFNVNTPEDLAIAEFRRAARQ
ncbi:molybdenum cofactor guanylyltransferase MobA [Xanthobacter autotrophicus DSM 431]|uniref:molybdenum cofactor guanylyltransferase MobA n=1 Tax=Xanthobacter nonsaccharivorans TaxID=3119912 RepID=UPI003728D90B